MKVSNHLHAPYALFPQTAPRFVVELESELALNLDGTLWGREKSVIPTPRHPSPHATP